MLRVHCLFGALLALGLGACSSAGPLTQAESRPGVDFSRYHTYNFLDAVAPNDSAVTSSGTNIFDLKRSVGQQLEARGFRRADQPDLLVNIGLVDHQRVQTREANFRTDGAPYYIGQRNFHWQANPIPVGSYREGTATIDVVDAARRELLWQGTTTSVLSNSPSKASEQIAKDVSDVFAKFPVPAR